MRTVESALQIYQLDHGAYPLSLDGFSNSDQSMQSLKTEFSDPLRTNIVSKRVFSSTHLFLLGCIMFASTLGWLLRKNGKLGDIENPEVRYYRLLLISVSVPIFVVLIMLSTIGSVCFCPEKIKSVQDIKPSDAIFGYQYLGYGFILRSNGPDGDIDFQGIAIDQNFTFDEDALMETLKPLMYDTSNGSISNGDLFRVVGNGL